MALPIYWWRAEKFSVKATDWIQKATASNPHTNLDIWAECRVVGCIRWNGEETYEVFVLDKHNLLLPEDKPAHKPLPHRRRE